MAAETVVDTAATPAVPETTTALSPKAGPVGCYLCYEPSSGGRLVLHYSQGPVPPNAVGFWCTPAKIPAFKFKQAAGRSELIKGIAGGDAGKRRYYTGWCQFVKLATRQESGRLIQFTPETQGIPVDVYAYHQATNSCRLLDLEAELTEMKDINAVAVMARDHEFLKGVKTIAMSNFLELGNLAGASTII